MCGAYRVKRDMELQRDTDCWLQTHLPHLLLDQEEDEGEINELDHRHPISLYIALLVVLYDGCG